MAWLHKLEFKKAGLSGLFLLGFAALAVAEPLRLEVQEPKADRDLRTGEPTVTLKMTKDSQQAFAALTQRHVGKPLEVRIDGKVMMTAVIREPIVGGTIQISGNLTDTQANETIRKVRAGAAIEVELPDGLR
jgi:preprotein translocase subunit SecD